MNVGILTILWRMNVFMMALADYFINGQHLKYFHIIGLFSIMVCTVCIALTKGTPSKLQQHLLPIWIPITFGILAPAFMTINGMQIKHLTKDHIGFETTKVTLSALIAFNVIILIFAIPYWHITHTFSHEGLYWGILGGIIGTLGFTFLQNAFVNGPGGPIYAITAMSSPCLVIIEAFY